MNTNTMSTDSTTVNLGSNTESSVEQDDITQDLTVSISKPKLKDLFKGLFWIKLLLLLFLTVLFIGGCTLSVLQSWGWEELLYQDISQARGTLEIIQGMNMPEDGLVGVAIIPPVGKGMKEVHKMC